jgi:hypothetical protein
MSNPYEPPKAPITALGPAGVGEDQCPSCQSTSVRKPGFTWWGGAIGPRMLNHRICNSCGFGYNAKTGKSNTTAIIVYQVVLFVIFFAIFFALNSK